MTTVGVFARVSSETAAAAAIAPMALRPLAGV